MSRNAPSKCIQYFCMKVGSCTGFTGWPSGASVGGLLSSGLTEMKKCKKLSMLKLWIIEKYLPWRDGRRMHRNRGVCDAW